MYQRHIPEHLRPLFGGKSVIRRYIPKTTGKQMALALARAWAVEHDAKIGVYKRIPELERTLMVADGGLAALNKSGEVVLADVVLGQTTDDWRRAILEPMQPNPFVVHEFAKQIANRAAGDIGHAKAVAEANWGVLFSEWKRISEAKNTRNHATTIRLLKDYFGEQDCRKITRADIGKFRDHLEKQGASWGTIKQRLNHIKAMYSKVSTGARSAVFDGMGNPAAGVLPVGKPPTNNRDKAFTGEEVQLILDAATRLRFGDNTSANGFKRHTEVMWLLRLLAYTGARPNEIAQLQVADVYEKHGVKLIHIRADHPQKSVKTGEDRLVPLHADVIEFHDYARTFAPNAFVFGAFPYNKDNGRALWLIRVFGQLLKECGIEGKTLYGLRHRFHDAMDLAGIPDKQARRLVGHAHKDSHEGYGSRVLKLLNECMQKIRPLKD